ncbi:MAG: type I-U CRISPR-associated protein Cas5/Cas6 [Proteobacteria bacterium]|nr:type I-U CRISPR-associated protein Cas5/Cas6 [Pseudomonadota bacterium]
MPDRWLVLEARFHAGLYRGSEWPPSPFRLLQAIVAGNRSIKAPGLAWFEQQAAPDIFAPAEVPESRYTIYVPNNTDRRKRDGQSTARDVIERRVSGPVRYVYALRSDTDLAEAAQLIGTASQLHTLGSGQDQASLAGRIEGARPASVETECHYAPSHASRLMPLRSDVDVQLRVPVAGSLVALEERFQASQTRLSKDKGWFSPVLAPAVHEVMAYSPAGQAARVAMLPLHLRKPEQAQAFRPFDARNAVVVAALLRGAIMRRTETSRLADFAAGYGPETEPDHRLSWVPLPSLGHAHTDGLIRRALLMAPIECLPEVAELAGVLGQDALQMTDEDSGECVAQAVLADPDDGVFNAYRRESTEWTSITPVILPGDHADSPRLVRNLILKALRHAGIDTGLLADFSTSCVPFLPQSHHVGDYRLKAWKATRLIPLHVRLRFHRPLRGPLLLGRGRHFGLGVFCGTLQ